MASILNMCGSDDIVAEPGLGISKSDDFNPYIDNHGTLACIGGDGFTILASDTRLVLGYSVLTRNQTKIFKLTDEVYLGLTYCWCDCLAFAKELEYRLKFYEFDHNKPINVKAAARLVSNLLYHKRFFPYHVGAVLTGLESDGTGVTYHYDPVGSMLEVRYTAGGAVAAAILSFLDSQLEQDNNEMKNVEPITEERALSLIHDAFVSVSEREIFVGDSIHCVIIRKGGIVEEKEFQLRKD